MGVHDLIKTVESNPSAASLLQSFTGKTITYWSPGDPIFDTFKRASTISHIDAADPPFFIIHGDDDLAVEISQSKILPASLNASGIPNRLLIPPANNRSELGKATGPIPYSRAASWLLAQFDRSAGIAVQHSKSL